MRQVPRLWVSLTRVRRSEGVGVSGTSRLDSSSDGSSQEFLNRITITCPFFGALDFWA
ncbi:hypothetical protein CGMCC3_g17782 [Colletotrichum fructicola]|nr:uncharacterized protein CGMCC3_g17782 [Colletotrichum fructicola]KAE9566040.1 hypothetical protein CGMCC3_g17782 [Colletotrichum fructicola]